MAGRDIKIVVQAWQDSGRSALNEPVVEWVTYCTVWASRKDKSDAEAEVAGAAGSAAVALFRVRSNSATRAITPAHRVWDGARAWNIKGIMLDNHRGRGDLVTITAVADSLGGNR